MTKLTNRRDITLQSTVNRIVDGEQ